MSQDSHECVETSDDVAPKAEPMLGVFGLTTAHQLREKLARDFAKLEAQPLDVDAAFNFFVTAEHMLDWIIPGRGRPQKKKRARIRGSEVLLEISWMLASGAKHFQLDKSQHEIVAETRQTAGYFGARYFDSRYFGKRYFAQGSLIVDLGEAAAKKMDVASIEAVELAGRVLAYWEAQDLELLRHV